MGEQRAIAFLRRCGWVAADPPPRLQYLGGVRDRDVRGALHQRLSLEHAAEVSETLFVDELGLCGHVRVDVAVVNGSLSGYELKSAKDNLRRLATQVEVYSRVLDNATLVVAQNHADHAKRFLPTWWGCIEASWDGRHVTLTTVVEATENPNIDPFALAQLLWRDEALLALTERGRDGGMRSKPRIVIWERLASDLHLDELRRVVREQLKSRPRWRSGR